MNHSTPPAARSTNTPDGSVVLIVKPTSNIIPAIYTPYNEEWDQRNATAHGLLFGNLINPVPLGLVRTETTAESWQKLQTIFGKTTSLGLVDAQRKLRNTFWSSV
ncbi:hypothetical protein C8J57DRAFT_1249859 [Mycena rebaudengoi]|nr:hypothetical protein C8J57DRAFT_1249859 [Mycena rebaudengoi]